MRSILALLLAWPIIAPVSGEKLGSGEYLRTKCARYTQHYGPLVASQLDSLPFEITLASVSRRLTPEHHEHTRLSNDAYGWPVLYIVDGGLYVEKSLQGRRPLFNIESYAVPVLTKLTESIRFSDMAMLYTMWDNAPVVRSEDEPGPWFGYCGVKQEQNNLLLPFELSHSKTGCREGLDCSFGAQDSRDGRAIFIGSQTGWVNGRRRAVSLAGINSTHTVYARIKNTPSISIDDPKLRPALDTVETMSLEDQVSQYKYIVHVEGNCAALRLASLLASPSAVMKVTSDQDEWFTPLLKPYKHYIPVNFAVHNDGSGYSVNLAEQVKWAEGHPEAVANIVRNANTFAKAFLSSEGRSCYATLLLHEYALRQRDPWSIREQRNNMNKADPGNPTIYNAAGDTDLDSGAFVDLAAAQAAKSQSRWISSCDTVPGGC